MNDKIKIKSVVDKFAKYCVDNDIGFILTMNCKESIIHSHNGTLQSLAYMKSMQNISIDKIIADSMVE